MEYETAVKFAHTAPRPLIFPTVPTAPEGSTVICWQFPRLTPQAFPAVTQIVPEADPNVIVTELVP